MASRFLSTRLISSLAQQQRGTPEGAFGSRPRSSVLSPSKSGASGSRRKPKFSALMERIHEIRLAEVIHATHYRAMRRRVMVSATPCPKPKFDFFVRRYRDAEVRFGNANPVK
jgi:hypothetical protein